MKIKTHQQKSRRKHPGEGRFLSTCIHLHDKWEQGVSTAYNQVACEIAQEIREMRLSGQQDVSNARG